MQHVVYDSIQSSSAPSKDMTSQRYLYGTYPGKYYMAGVFSLLTLTEHWLMVMVIGY